LTFLVSFVAGLCAFRNSDERVREPRQCDCAQPYASRLDCSALPITLPRMELADFMLKAQESPALPFLVIGGLAVAAHGHVRATFDIDFLVRRVDREVWHERMLNAGMQLFGETRAFAQFTQEGGDGLDLMFVDDATFDPMWQASEEREFGSLRSRVPCLDHLLALKLHALKQELPHRTSRDAEDIEMLVRRNDLKLREPRYEQLFLKYGTREIYETFLRLTRGPR
jgi:hypothetical protein